MRVNIETQQIFINNKSLTFSGDVVVPTLSSDDSNASVDGSEISNKIINGAYTGAPPPSFYEGLTENVSNILQDLYAIESKLSSIPQNVVANYTGAFSEFLQTNELEHAQFWSAINALPDQSGIGKFYLQDVVWSDTTSDNIVVIRANNAHITPSTNKVYFIVSSNGSTFNGDTLVDSAYIFIYNNNEYINVYRNPAPLIEGVLSGGTLTNFKFLIIENANTNIGIDSYKYNILVKVNSSVTINNQYSDPIEINFFSKDTQIINLTYKTHQYNLVVKEKVTVILHGQHIHIVNKQTAIMQQELFDVEFDGQVENNAFVFFDTQTKKAVLPSSIQNQLLYYLTPELQYPIVTNRYKPYNECNVDLLAISDRGCFIYRTTTETDIDFDDVHVENGMYEISSFRTGLFESVTYTSLLNVFYATTLTDSYCYVSVDNDSYFSSFYKIAYMTNHYSPLFDGTHLVGFFDFKQNNMYTPSTLYNFLPIQSSGRYLEWNTSDGSVTYMSNLLCTTPVKPYWVHALQTENEYVFIVFYTNNQDTIIHICRHGSSYLQNTTITLESLTLPPFTAVAVSDFVDGQHLALDLCNATGFRRLFVSMSGRPLSIPTRYVALGRKISNTTVDAAPLVAYDCRKGMPVYAYSDGTVSTIFIDGAVQIGSGFVDGYFILDRR